MFGRWLVVGLVLMAGCHVITGLDDIVPCEGNCDPQASSASGGMSGSGTASGSGGKGGSGTASSSGAMSGSGGPGGAPTGCWGEFVNQNLIGDDAKAFSDCVTNSCSTQCTPITPKVVCGDGAMGAWPSTCFECYDVAKSNNCWDCIERTCAGDLSLCDPTCFDRTAAAAGSGGAPMP